MADVVYEFMVPGATSSAGPMSAVKKAQEIASAFFGTVPYELEVMVRRGQDIVAVARGVMPDANNGR